MGCFSNPLDWLKNGYYADKIAKSARNNEMSPPAHARHSLPEPVLQRRSLKSDQKTQSRGRASPKSRGILPCLVPNRILLTSKRSNLLQNLGLKAPGGSYQGDLGLEKGPTWAVGVLLHYPGVPGRGQRLAAAGLRASILLPLLHHRSGWVTSKGKREGMPSSNRRAAQPG